MTLLVLGGTSEATALVNRLPPPFVLSLAGRTENPVLPACPTRIGGFGGVAGLCAFIRANRIRGLIDATHPFAARMSLNAAEACAKTGLPRLVLTRRPWRAEAGDQWRQLQSLEAMVEALETPPERIFLTLGRLHLAAFRAAPQHHYIIRSIDAPDVTLPNETLIRARPPFSLESELALMTDQKIDRLITKNSGGAATYAKIEAARSLGLPVMLWERPPLPPGDVVYDVEAALQWLATHQLLP